MRNRENREYGDGKIFIIPVEEVIRVRTVKKERMQFEAQS